MYKLGKRVAGILLAAGVAISLFVATPVTSLANATGTVNTPNVKVRESASTTAKQVSSLREGDVVDIVEESTDASGYTWYKIFVNKSEYGYVRADLVNKSGNVSKATSTTSTTTSTASLPETQVTATEQKSATVTSESVNVRKGAGTAYDSVGKVKKGDTVTITGEANGTDGKTWYQITFGANSSTGFVRNDLVAISDGAPAETTENPAPAEGENTEAPAEGGEVTENTENTEATEPASTTVASPSQGDGKYSLVYSTEEDGSGIWYLYSYDEGGTGGYRVKVDDLIAAAQSADAVNNLRKQSNNYKKIAIFLGVLAAALVAGIVVLALKLRDSLYYEDEEEEEEYDRYSTNNRRASRNDDRSARRPERSTTEERTVRPTRRPADEEYERSDRRPQRQDREDREEREERSERRPLRSERAERPERPLRRTAEGRDEERPSRRPAREDDRPVRRSTEERRAAETKEEAPKRRARNFVGDDDDFEFEFLDLDD